MRRFEPMSLANMRQNGVRSVIATCANCGRSADINVDLLPETLTVPRDRQTPAMQQLRRQDDIDPTCVAHREPPPRHAGLLARTASDVLTKAASAATLAQGRAGLKRRQ
jgi:hypothetical protein